MSDKLKTCQLCSGLGKGVTEPASPLEISDDAIRVLIICRLDDVKKLILSSRAVDIVSWIGDKEVTSSDLAEKYSISVASASAQLARLYLKGYVSRVETTDPTGGYLYAYKSAVSR